MRHSWRIFWEKSIPIFFLHIYRLETWSSLRRDEKFESFHHHYPKIPSQLERRGTLLSLSLQPNSLSSTLMTTSLFRAAVMMMTTFQ